MVSDNDIEELKRTKLAAACGIAGAQLSMGFMCATGGRGVVQDDVVGMPRVVTSRGNKLTSGAASAVSKAQIKRNVLENALELGKVGLVGALGKEDEAKLKVMMADLKKKSRE